MKMDLRERLSESLVAVYDIERGDLEIPIYEIGNGEWGKAAPDNLGLPGSRLPNANVRILSPEHTEIIGEATVRGDVRGFIVEAWSEGDDAATALNAAVNKLIEIERQNGNPEFGQEQEKVT